MITDTIIIQIIIALVQQAGLIIIISLLLSRLTIFTRIVRRTKRKPGDYLFPVMVLGGLGIIGTYTGVPIQGALANARMVPVFIGGLLGGPVVGVLAGLIAGFHRWAFDIGGFTAVSCMVSTIAEGAMAGFLSRRFYNSPRKSLFALLSAAAAEGTQMLIILATAHPFADAVSLVSIISIPMITANSIGCALIILAFENLFNEGERIAARQSQQVLKIADQTLPLLRKGLSEETARRAAEIIYKEMSLEAVAVTDRSKILIHVGKGDDHHTAGVSLLTKVTREVMRTGELQVAMTRAEIGCKRPDCSLKSAVIAPLKRETECIGTLKLYKGEENSISQTDIETARGLAALFSSQLELSRLEEQKELLRKAELRALQAQINPHFLFNAINTIVSLIRTEPEKGRNLLLHLGTFYRNNLQSGTLSVPLETEINHIKAYLEIEKARFGSRLEILYRMEKGLNLNIPPLLLQPLVENAVIHGIQPRPEGGTVTISASSTEEGIVLSVNDNGLGLVEDRPSLCEDPENEQSDSIGLINIRQRLLNAYGPSADLQLECDEEKGTTARIFIPVGAGT
jgi:two-component system, LytTR family, sensor histidine kinase LytS